MTPDSPSARVFREPFAFDFFRAVRLLEEMAPGRAPVGGGGPPAAEVVRFASVASLAFPAASIDRLDPGPTDTDPPRMAVNFFGLTGPNGVLPLVYTQWQIARTRAAGDPEAEAYADWLDLFTHRLLSLFYRAGVKYRLPAGFERADRAGRRDQITAAALALIGLGTPGLADRLQAEGGGRRAEGGEGNSSPPSALHPPSSEPAGIEDIALLRYAELFSHATRPAAGLEGMLADYFGVPVTIQSFRGRWLPLDPENQTRLGRRGANDRLGDGTLVGRRVWDAAGGFRIVLGPLDRPAFRSWLPDRPRMAVLAKLVRFYTRDQFRFAVQLVLKADAVRPLRLGRVDPPARLGWNTWVTTRPPSRAVGDARFRHT